MVITAHHHPGHTKGATSFTFDVRENNKTYRVGIVNMARNQSRGACQRHAEISGYRQAYAQTFHDQKEMKIDVWLASHAGQFGLHREYQPGDAYNPDRFVDPEGFQAGVAGLEKVYRDQLAKEQQGK